MAAMRYPRLICSGRWLIKPESNKRSIVLDLRIINRVLCVFGPVFPLERGNDDGIDELFGVTEGAAAIPVVVVKIGFTCNRRSPGRNPEAMDRLQAVDIRQTGARDSCDS